MAKSPLTLLLLFVGVFLLLMIAYAGIAGEHNDDNTNTSETQDLQSDEQNQTEEMQKPFMIGLGGFLIILVLVLLVSGLAFFARLMFKHR